MTSPPSPLCLSLAHTGSTAANKNGKNNGNWGAAHQQKQLKQTPPPTPATLNVRQIIRQQWQQWQLGAKSTNWQPQQGTPTHIHTGGQAWHMSLKLQQSLEQQLKRDRETKRGRERASKIKRSIIIMMLLRGQKTTLPNSRNKTKHRGRWRTGGR